jgi:signal recognition particle subunit SRP54
MFSTLTERLEGIFKRMRGYGRLSEENIQEGLREVRLALLEADVHFKVVKDFIERIKVRAIGQEVMESLTPGQQLVKIVHDELVALLGGFNQRLNLAGAQPAAIMLAGLQGSGKTTTAAKLALWLRSKGRRPYLVPADIYRPAAIDQLKVLAKQIQIDVFSTQPSDKPVDIVRKAKAEAIRLNKDTLIIDTAGRLHIDEALMQELKDIKTLMSPQEILLVVDAMTGQDAVNMAKSFNEAIEITGVVLTKMDGDARGGAALSIQSITGKPLKFVGVSEKLDGLEPFYPDRLANRILGMGDVLSLIEKVQQNVDQKKTLELKEKIKKDAFTLEDFKDQLLQIKKMGGLAQVISMIPGINKLKQVQGMMPEEKELSKIIAIIDSMTPMERADWTIINASRRKRIARGSGTTVQDVNKLLKNYAEMAKMLKKIKKTGLKGFARGFNPFG